jgi:DNA modification methylase
MTVRLICGDCLEAMAGMEAQSVDAIITDLPYGTTACKWDVVIPFAPMWAAVKRVLKPRGVFVTTASQPFTSALVMSNTAWFRYEWIWCKDLATGHLNAHRRPMLEHESLLVFAADVETYHPQGIRAYGRMNRRGGNGDNYGVSGLVNLQEFTAYPRTIIPFSVHRSEGQHPTQKPVALYAYLIRTYTNEGDTVLDMCCGSGTTGVACVETGRNFIGIEKEAAYVNIARRRIEAAQAQLRMDI